MVDLKGKLTKSKSKLNVLVSETVSHSNVFSLSERTTPKGSMNQENDTIVRRILRCARYFSGKNPKLQNQNNPNPRQTSGG